MSNWNYDSEEIQNLLIQIIPWPYSDVCRIHTTFLKFAERHKDEDGWDIDNLNTSFGQWLYDKAHGHEPHQKTEPREMNLLTEARLFLLDVRKEIRATNQSLEQTLKECFPNE